MEREFSYSTLAEIESQCGGNFFVADLARFEHNWKRLAAAFQSHYVNSQLAWSYKTNYLPAICRRVEAIGGWAEVVSEMEFDLAIACDADPARIIINGPALSPSFFQRALAAGAIINVDHIEAFRQIQAIQKSHANPVARLCIRCNFPAELAGPSRFGVRVGGDAFREIIAAAKRESELSLIGLHCHYCPAVRSAAAYGKIAGLLIETAQRSFEDDPPELLNFGGGFMSPMPADMRDSWDFDPPSFKDYGAAIASRMAAAFSSETTRLMIEPGVSVCADTMSFFCRVVALKTHGQKRTAIVSGSIYDIRPTKSTRNFPVTVYSSGNQATTGTTDITGYTCMEDDCLVTNYEGPIAVGDIVQFHQTGSYSIVLKPPFINPAAPIVAVDEEKITTLRRRETFGDVFSTFQ